MALVVSVVVTFFLYGHIKRQYAMTARPIKVVAAARPLEPGKPLVAEDLTLADWPVNLPLTGTAGKPESFLGRIVLYPVAAQEPIREPLLAAPGAAVGLTAKIPDGMRAVAIQTNEVNNVSGFLFPGCHVDALVTFRPDNGKESVTMTVLQNVEVLSTGEKLQPDPAGKPQNVKEVTVLLTPDDAQKLVLASNQGTVQFVLRNSSDQQQAERRPVELKDLGSTAPQAAPVAVKRAAPAPKAASAYEIETYDGTKKGVVKF